MKKISKKILSLCMAVAMMACMAPMALESGGTKGVEMRLDGEISLSNVVSTDIKKYPEYGIEDEPNVYICNSSAEITTHSKITILAASKVEIVDGEWTPVKEIPVTGKYKIRYWDENETNYWEQEPHTGEVTIDYKDLDSFEMSNPNYFIVGRLEEGAKITLTEKGIYVVIISVDGNSLDADYTVVVTGDSDITPAPSTVQAKPTASSVLVDGKQTAFDAYTIGGNNYFKLRDLAYSLNDSRKQFEVKWDGANNAIRMTSGAPYTPVGGEMQSKGLGDKIATPTKSKLILNGKEITLTAYIIGGNNYFKLRDIGKAFNFGVEWDGERNSIFINTSNGYSE